MNKHKHDHCEHAKLKFCLHCQKPYCLDCGEEWPKESIQYVNAPIYRQYEYTPFWGPSTAPVLPTTWPIITCGHTSESTS